MDNASVPALRLRRTSDDRLVCRKLILGESFGQRLMGLMGRASMEPDEGLYLETSSIHMMFMRFPIDALFTARPDESGERRVVAMRKGLPPWRGIVLPIRGAHGVVELPAGTLDDIGVNVGDSVVFESAEPESREQSAA
jgi:uncharacterized membrane protein (UPF0127 family)